MNFVSLEVRITERIESEDEGIILIGIVGKFIEILIMRKVSRELVNWRKL